jgi:RNA polymerase sigma factor (sigma-70 family)
MDESQGVDDADDELADSMTKALPSQSHKDARKAKHLATVETEAAQFASMNWPSLRSSLREVIAGQRVCTTEALVRICSMAHQQNDRPKFNLAFEAASKTAVPLLISQGFGQIDDRHDQAQEVLLQLFAAISQGKAQLAQTFFAAYAKRRAIDLFRRNDTQIEAKMDRIDPTETVDPIETLSDSTNVEAKALFSIAIDKLPPKHRTAFIQYHRFGMTQEEIAVQADVDVRTVRDWLKEARAALGLKGDANDR